MAKNEGDMREEEEMLAGSGPRVYELGFHIDPELPTEEVKKTYQAIKEGIEAAGQVVALGEPKKMPLAYTISRQETGGRRDFDSAYFAWIAYECDSTKHEEAIAGVKNNLRIVRFLDILTTKEAARHSAELALLEEKMPEKSIENSADAQLDAALEEVLPAQASAV